ncbi:antirepressor [Mycobacterium phage Iwokeuplikedis]|nr:antirepressor [Mycobacterium phage Iwokeuplikedis]
MSTTTIEKFQFQNVPSADEGGLVIDTQVRVVVLDGEPWFIAKDVTDILGFKKSYEAVTQHILPDQRTTVNCGSGPNPVRTAISEAGLYRLIMRSNVPAAAKFQAWVTDEVLPTIRKTGAYVDPSSELAGRIAAGDVDAMIQGFAKTLQIAQEARAALAKAEEKLAVDAPKVRAADEFFDMEGLYSLRDAARKFGVPPFTFNDILRSWGWIDEKGTAAKAYAVSMGYAENRIYIHPGSGAATTQGRLTGKGLERAAIKLEKEGTWVGYAAAR